MNDESRHSVPPTETTDHITSGIDCWCAPTYLLPCDECEIGCWKCDGGTTPLTRNEAASEPRPIVIVHNR